MPSDCLAAGQTWVQCHRQDPGEEGLVLEGYWHMCVVFHDSCVAHNCVRRAATQEDGQERTDQLGISHSIFARCQCAHVLWGLFLSLKHRAAAVQGRLVRHSASCKL